MNRHRKCLATIATLIVVTAGMWASADSTLDVKRRLALDLTKENKTQEAIGLLQEIVTADAGNFRDHLALARLYDKLNRPDEALAAYVRVAALASNPVGADERQARLEAERRIKVLDQASQKMHPIQDELLKKLDAIERDAARVKDFRVLERAFRLRGACWNNEKRPDRRAVEVHARDDWAHTGLIVKQGTTYRIRAVGTWSTGKLPASGPEGVNGKLNGSAPMGALLATVAGTSDYVAVGYEVLFTPSKDGELMLAQNETHANHRVDNSGSVIVLIEAQTGN